VERAAGQALGVKSSDMCQSFSHAKQWNLLLIVEEDTCSGSAVARVSAAWLWAMDARIKREATVCIKGFVKGKWRLSWYLWRSFQLFIQRVSFSWTFLLRLKRRFLEWN
jgi:hypothetical protein